MTFQPVKQHAYDPKKLRFEIIYCGCDTDELMMTDFYKKQQEEGGTWLAVPMSEQGLLDQCFGIRKVPAFAT